MLMASLGGPMEEEATARKKLQDAGFDPDSPRLLRAVIPSGGWYDNAMARFCRVGDLKMCRYLLSKGALVTQTWNDDDDDGAGNNVNGIPSPMISAARGGHVHICKWLCEHGGRGDIRRVNTLYYGPLYNALMSFRLADSPRKRRQREEMYRWLILNEALCPHGDGNVDRNLIRNAFRYEVRDEGPHVLEWAEGAIQTYDGFMTFLMGTHRREAVPFSKQGLERLLKEKRLTPGSVSAIMAHLPEDQQILIWSKEQKLDCEVQCLAGHPGIRKKIAAMLGAVRGRELRIMRNMEVMLRSFLEEVPHRSTRRR